MILYYIIFIRNKTKKKGIIKKQSNILENGS
jgi:hypothetical protein